MCFCDEHIRCKRFKYCEKDRNYPCPKCSYPTAEVSDLSLSCKFIDNSLKYVFCSLITVYLFFITFISLLQIKIKLTKPSIILSILKVFFLNLTLLV